MIDVVNHLEDVDGLAASRFTDMETIRARVSEMTFPECKGRRRTSSVSYSRVSRCIRGGFFDSLGHPEPIYEKNRIAFDFGTMRHDTIQDVLLERGVLRPNPESLDRSPAEFKLSLEEPPVLGFCDGVMVDSDDLLEIKTTGVSITDARLPFEGHVSQGMFYIYLARLQGLDPRRVIILYETKRNEKRAWKQFVLPYDEYLAKRVVGRCTKLMRHLRNNALPRRDRGCYCTNPACYDREIHQKEGLI